MSYDHKNLDLELFKEKEKYNCLLDLYNEQNIKYEKLMIDYEKLNNEFKENTIIESMNNMKIQYDELIKTTVSKYTYDLVYKKLHRLKQKNTALIILLEYIEKKIENLYNKFLYGSQRRVEIQQIKSQLSTLSEILNDEDDITVYTDDNNIYNFQD